MQKILKDSTMKLSFSYGMDKDGKEIIKTKSFSSVNNTALEQNVYDVGKAFSSLTNNSLTGIYKIDNSELAD